MHQSEFFFSLGANSKITKSSPVQIGLIEQIKTEKKKKIITFIVCACEKNLLLFKT